MNDEKKTKAQLIKELKSLRKQLNVNNISVPAAKNLMKNIKDAKEYLETVIKTSHNGIMVLDANGRFEFGNKSFFQIIGWPKKDIIGEKFIRVVPDDSKDFMLEEWYAVLVGKGKPYETEILTKKGQRRRLYVNCNDMDIDGQKKYCVVVNDITESKKNELALKESEGKFRGAFETASHGMAIVSIEGRWLKANKALCKIVGYSQKQLQATDFQSITHPDDLDADLGYIRQLLADEIESYNMEKRYFHKRGHIVWVLLSVSLVRDVEGDPLYFVSQIQDITEQKTIEERLHEGEKNYTRLIETMPDGLGAVDSDGIITFINKAFTDMLGYSEKNAVGKHVSILFNEEGFTQYKKQLLERKKDAAETYHVDLRHIDGHMVPVVVRPAAMFDDDGNFKGSFGVFTDLTNQRKIQSELVRSEKRYKLLYETSQDAITIVDPEQGFISANPAAIKLFGFKNERDILFKMADVVSPQFQPDGELSNVKIEKITKDTFKNGSHVFEWQHKRPDGSEFLGTVLFTVMEQDGKKLLLATTRDITEQKKAQEAIKNLLDFENLITEVSTSFINLPVERTDTGINIALGILSKFLRVDRSSVVLFSDDLSIANTVYEWCGKGMVSRREQIKEFSTENFRWWITRLKRGDPIYMHSLDEFPKSAANEKEFFASANVKSYVTVPLFFNKELIGFMNFYSIKTTKVWEGETISLLKIVAEIFVNTIMRSHSQRELREYDAKMFRTEQLASLGIISANIAHELNQPLTVIQLLLQQVKRSLTKKSGDIAVVEENINDSLSELTRAAEIVARFRTFARQSSPGSIEMIDVCMIAESLVKALSSGARKTVLKLSLKKPRKTVYVRATAADIEQIFFVLIENSIQAANPKVKNFLDINISCKKNNILIDFQDNCGGVAQELVSKIFDPFFTTKPRQEGTGLGLPILERIVKRYEGGIKYENHPGHGIIFHISLPMNK